MTTDTHEVVAKKALDSARGKGEALSVREIAHENEVVATTLLAAALFFVSMFYLVNASNASFRNKVWKVTANTIGWFVVQSVYSAGLEKLQDTFLGCSPSQK